MWATGTRANRIWIYGLTFCAFIFGAVTLGLLWDSVTKRVGWQLGTRYVLGSLLLFHLPIYKAIQRRRQEKKPDGVP